MSGAPPFTALSGWVAGSSVSRDTFRSARLPATFSASTRPGPMNGVHRPRLHEMSKDLLESEMALARAALEAARNEIVAATLIVGRLEAEKVRRERKEKV
jgi:hypothetical protein